MPIEDKIRGRQHISYGHVTKKLFIAMIWSCLNTPISVGANKEIDI